jgi:glycosyltransferase involved in cell wall biosynthesis
VGGAQIHAHQLAVSLSSRHQVRVACQWTENRTDWLLGTTLRAQGPARSYGVDGVPVSTVSLTPAERLSLLPWTVVYYGLQGAAIRRVATTLAAHLLPLVSGADLVHNVRVGREGISYGSLLTARRLRIPFVFTPLHHPRWETWLHRHFHRLYREADAILAMTEAEKRTLARLGVHDERVFVTGNGAVLAASAEPERFRERFGIRGPMVLFLGQKYAYKGYAALLKAAPSVWRTAPDTHFVFLGPRTRRSEAVFRAVRDPRIVEAGTVDLQEKTDALAASDVFCMPSTQESFGAVFLEAWNFARPVIGGSCPALRELIVDGEGGFVIPQDADEIAGRLVELLTNPGLCRLMGERGRKKALSEYTWPRIAERAERAYRAVTGAS